jgi:hypothetical protein
MNGWLALLATIVAVPGAFKAYDAVYARWRRWQSDEMKKRRDAALIGRYALHTIYPDEKGHMPLVYDANAMIRNPETLAAFTVQTVQERYPELERLSALVRMMENSGNANGQPLEQLPAQIINQPLPSRVPLSGMLDGPPSYRDLLLGVTQDESGQLAPVKVSLSRLVHIAIGGITGWGKSVFLRQLAYQLVKSVEPIDVALVDLEGVTFAPFSQSNRLLFPIADNETDAKAVYRALLDEMERRKALYAEIPGVTSLDAYNRQADEPIRPIVSLTDESTALFEDREIESTVKTLILRARKYGLWLVMGGQDWKASSLDTAIREQFATRVQFKTMSPTSSRVLLQRGGAEDLNVAGRALAWIPGHDLIEMQSPIINESEIMNAIDGTGPRGTFPSYDAGDRQVSDGQIRDLDSQGLSKRQIALRLFGYSGGHAHERITQALQST